MQKDETTKNRPSIDPELLNKVTREVIARLRATMNTSSIPDRIITQKSVETLNGSPKQLYITKQAVVTPAARDEARRRGITIHRTAEATTNAPNEHVELEITDASNPQRAESVRSQIARRGFANGPARIVLSDQPAGEVHRLCGNGERAVMITCVQDVQRFADEFSPTIWVLDMKRLNLAAAVNVTAQITQSGNQFMQSGNQSR